MITLSKFSNSPDELSENDELREFELSGSDRTHRKCIAGADPGFDQGGPQIVTGLKLPFWGLSFVEFWCWGLIFGGQGGAWVPGPPRIRPCIG